MEEGGWVQKNVLKEKRIDYVFMVSMNNLQKTAVNIFPSMCEIPLLKF